MQVDVSKLGKRVDVRWYRPFDSNGDQPNQWNDAKLKVLCVFMSPGRVRAPANTFTTLRALIKTLPFKTFVDYSYFPEKDDLPAFAEHQIPLIFGNVSGRTVEHYDIVLFSFSIIQEVSNIFFMLRSSGIPIYHKDRIDDAKWPLFVAGGVTIDDAESINGNSGVMDLVYYGQAEQGLTDFLTLFNKFHIDSLAHAPFTFTWKRKFIEQAVKAFNFLYYPAGYEFDYDGPKITNVRRLHGWLPEHVWYRRIFNMDDYPYFEDKVFTPDNGNATGADILISMGCSGSAGLCSFCSEGWLLGPWRELSFEEAKNRIHLAKRLGAPNTGSVFSFNSNYYSRYLDLLCELAKEFRDLSLINMRADVLAEHPDWLKVAKALGVNRISMATEGIGDRMRNVVLNKNLPFETWKKAAYNVFSQGFGNMKNGLVFTGWETEADFDSAIQEYQEIIAIRDKLQVNTFLQLTVTPLVVYDGVPLRYHPRSSARVSFNQERVFGKFLDAMGALGVRTRFNGGGLGTWFQQIVIDYGRKLTPFLDFWNQGSEHLFYSDFVSRKLKDELVETLVKTTGVHPDAMLHQERKHGEHIFPSHIFRRVTDEVEDIWQEEYFKNPVAYCLKTAVNLTPKCKGCHMCPDPDQIKKMTKRSIESEKKLPDVLSVIYSNKPMHATRVIAMCKRHAEVFGKQSYSHLIASHFLRQKPEWVTKFHSINTYSTKPMFEDEQRDYVWGQFAFDIFWKERVNASELSTFVRLINESFQDIEVIRIFDAEVKSSPYTGTQAVYTFESSIPRDKFVSGLLKYEGKVKRVAGGATFNYEYRDLPKSDFDLFAIAKGEGTVGYLRLPWEVNPHMLVSTVTGVSYHALLDVISICAITLQGAEAGQCNCGRAFTRFDLYTNAPAKVCPKCISDVIVSKLSK